MPLDGSIAEQGEPEPLQRGYDFYAAPRLSPDSGRLAWICWNHPQMPWDATELWLAEIAAGGALLRPRRAAGGSGGEASIIEPHWGPDGALYCVADQSGWWNLQRLELEGGALTPLYTAEAEFGQPMWSFSESSYGVLGDGRLGAAWGSAGLWKIGLLDPSSGSLTELETPYNSFFMVAAANRRIVANAGGAEHGSAIVAIDAATGAIETLRSSAAAVLDPAAVSIPEPIAYPSAGGRTAHAFYYAPRNPDFAAPAGERPPLLTFTHGGPTGAAPAIFSLAIQYWTTRGFAVIDVNYGGSTGYGTAYRRLLHGNWGIVDVEDCCAGAQYLVERGDVDGGRLAIRGGSAGGYTTLCALTYRDVFNAGASHFGVSDAAALARDTHKFESRYLDSLNRPLPGARGAVSAALADLLRRSAQLPGDLLAGPGRQDRPARSGRADGRGAAREGRAGRLSGLRGRAARLPHRGQHPARHRGRARLLRPHLRLHPGRRGLSRLRSTISSPSSNAE